MAENYIKTTVEHDFEGFTPEKVAEELNQREIELKNNSEANKDELERIEKYKPLMAKYADEFSVLYRIYSRAELAETEEGNKPSFDMKEVAFERPLVATEAQDITEKNSQLEMDCRLDEDTHFGIRVTSCDRADKHFNARIDFDEDSLAKLNAERFAKIIAFCERYGFSVYQMSLPKTSDGLIDVDEKLQTLLNQYMERRRMEDEEHPGPDAESMDEKEFNMLEATTPEQPNLKPAKKPLDFEGLRKNMREFLEKDMHKRAELSYFERTKVIDGKRMIVFSVYEKENRDNLKMDGRNDPNNPDKRYQFTPTYQCRLYISQDSDGKFGFGYATPGGAKMNDVIAGDFIGEIKKTGVTHLHFSGVSNQDKGVWLVACAEKGIIPVGLSINLSKAKMMVEKAKGKLNDEELALFKARLGEQMLENAKKKNNTPPNYGLSRSEMNFISSMKAGYAFENFRTAYNAGGGLGEKVEQKIREGAQDKEKGAATVMGAMHTLGLVFNIYYDHQAETFGMRIAQLVQEGKITKQEAEQLKSIPANKQMGELETADFNLMFDVLLVRQIENQDKEIQYALREEINNKVRRAPGIVITNDIFPAAKGAVNDINTRLGHDGLEALPMLPVDHKSLRYKDENQRQTPPQPQTQQTPAPTPPVVAGRGGQNSL